MKFGYQLAGVIRGSGPGRGGPGRRSQHRVSPRMLCRTSLHRCFRELHKARRRGSSSFPGYSRGWRSRQSNQNSRLSFPFSRNGRPHVNDTAAARPGRPNALQARCRSNIVRISLARFAQKTLDLNQVTTSHLRGPVAEHQPEKLRSPLAGAPDAAEQTIDASVVRVHQHGACITRKRKRSMGRSRRRDPFPIRFIPSSQIAQILG